MLSEEQQIQKFKKQLKGTMNKGPTILRTQDTVHIR